MFEKLIGYETEKRELSHIVYTLRNGNIGNTKGLLLVGSPGNGKTKFAQEIMLQSGIKSFTVNTASHDVLKELRHAYDLAKNEVEAIVFIDEADKLFKKDSTLANNDDIPSKEVLFLLKELEQVSNVFTILVSNDEHFGTRSLTRSGRIDNVVHLNAPTRNDRLAILKYYLSDYDYEIDSLAEVVQATEYFSCADLESLASKSCNISKMNKNRVITRKDFFEAVTRIMFKGIPKRIDSNKELEYRIAVHEIGHALVAYLNDPNSLISVTLQEVNDSLGFTKYVQDDNRITTTDDYKNDMAVLLGGYFAEILAFGNSSTGCHDDLRKYRRKIEYFFTKYGFETLNFLDHIHTSCNSAKLHDGLYESMNALNLDVQGITHDKLMKHRDKIGLLAKKLIEKKILFKHDFDESLHSVQL